MASTNIGDIVRNQTPEQKEARLKKAAETRAKNTEKRAELRKTLNQLEKETWQIPFYKWIKGSDGKWVKELVGYELVKGSRALATNLMRKALEEDGKDVVGAIKAIAELTGEYSEEKQNTTLIVQLNNDKLDI